MDKEELIKEYNTITNPNKDIVKIYHILDELGVNYKKTKCPRCRKDLQMIAAEELGLIENAAELSGFNASTNYRYLPKRPQSWKGHIIDENTPKDVVEEFIKVYPTGYYEKIEPQDEDINNEE